MSRLTDDSNDPDLGVPQPNGQHKAYLVLSKLERAKGFVRPFRDTYVHTACGTVTRMSQALAETYARNPKFYSHTFCAFCQSHFPVNQFVWNKTTELVGS